MPDVVFPGFVALDEVNNIVVGNDLFVLVVDATSKFLDFGKVVHSLFVVVDHFDDLGAVSGASGMCVRAVLREVIRVRSGWLSEDSRR